MTNPICFLLGAGASYPYGVPLMTGFYSEFRDLVARKYPPCFEFLQTIEQNNRHEQPDLETLLSDLNAVLGVEHGLAVLGADSAALAGHLSTAHELRGYLDAFIVDRCERFDRERSVRDLVALLGLRTDGPLWVFTTNYDRIVEHACDSHGVTWSDGFESPCPRPVANWLDKFDAEVCVVKLHGSVNWYEDDPGGDLHRLDRGYSLPAHDFRLLRQNQQLRPLMIIPTLEKQALRPPYNGFAVRFTDILKEVKVLVVAGNSLRDQHIKAYIAHRLNGLHVLLVSPSAAQHLDVLGCRERTYALNAGFSEFLTLGGPALLRLCHAGATAQDDGDVRTAIEQFVAEVSQGVEDDTAVRADPDLGRLWDDLQGESVARRVAAVKALRSRAHPAVIRRIATVLRDDGHPAVRAAAVETLVHLAGNTATDAIGEALLSDDAPEVQWEATLALMEEIGERSRDFLSRALQCPGMPSSLSTVITEALRPQVTPEREMPTH